MPKASADSALDPTVLARRQAFGQRLRELRTRARRTQADIAAAAGVDRAFYVNIEGGKNNVSLDKVFALADALGVDVERLFTGLTR
jgi:transcriptional regulator with XRE-family HTH domain